MTYEPSPGDSNRSSASERDSRSAARLDSELQPDPELAEGPASPAKMVAFVIGIAIVLGAVLYGLNHTTSEQPGGTSSTAQKTQSAPAPAPSGNNNQGASTTGSAPAQPQQPPSSAPAGQDINRSRNPPNNAPDK